MAIVISIRFALDDREIGQRFVRSMHPDRLSSLKTTHREAVRSSFRRNRYADPHVRRIHGTSLDDQPVDNSTRSGLRKIRYPFQLFDVQP